MTDFAFVAGTAAIFGMLFALIKGIERLRLGANDE